jgi:hypothetical protein
MVVPAVSTIAVPVSTFVTNSEHHEPHYMSFMNEALLQPTVREVGACIFHSFADVATAIPECPGCCLGINEALTSGGI